MPSWQWCSSIFQFRILWVLLLASPCKCLSWDFLHVLLILFSCHLSIQLYCDVLSFSILYSKIILLFLLPVADLSFCILYLPICWMFFRYLGMSCFVCIFWPCLGIFLNLNSSTNIFWFIYSICVVWLVRCCHFFLFIGFLYHPPYALLNVYSYKSINIIFLGVTLCTYLPNPSARAGYDTRSIFMRSSTGLNSEFSFS